MKIDIVNIIQLATCYLKTKRFQEAENILKKYAGNGNPPEICYYLGLSYAIQGKYKDAIDTLKNHLNSNPDTDLGRELIFQLLINEAQAALKKAEYNLVSDLITEAIKFIPSNTQYKEILSHFESVMPVSLIRLGEREKAAKMWIEELKQNSLPDSKTIHNLALLYYWWAIANEREILNEKNNIDENKRELADYLWSRTIMFWFSFIGSRNYWEELCADRSHIWKSNITIDDIIPLKSELSKNRLLKVLEEFRDNYQQRALDNDHKRILKYIINYFFEKRTTNYWTEFRELVINN